jgi:small subunit ribosomal protein S6
MRRYETILIVNPDLGEEQRQPVFDRIRELIPQKGGLLVEFDEWGMRKLAYEIQKKPRGYYARVDYCGGGDLVNEMERQFRIDDRVMKYMTVLLDSQADMERIQEEMVQKVETAASPADGAEAPTNPAASTAAATSAADDEDEATESRETDMTDQASNGKEEA